MRPTSSSSDSAARSSDVARELASRQGDRVGSPQVLQDELNLRAAAAAAPARVERPGWQLTPFLNHALSYACGVIHASLFETLGVPVWSIASSALWGIHRPRARCAHGYRS
jgi:hypothetical protein